jgi:E3 ubiquitin-protein ligase HUWE1
LAQRYYASRQRSPSNHLNSTLLASHYNIKLEKVEKIALPFVKSQPYFPSSRSDPSTPSGKGKEKALVPGNPFSTRSSSGTPVYLSDLVSVAKDTVPPNDSRSRESSESQPEQATPIKGKARFTEEPKELDDEIADWNRWGGAWVTFHSNSLAAPGDSKKTGQSNPAAVPLPTTPGTPTPSRRNTSINVQQTPRQSRLSISDESTDIPTSPAAHTSEDIWTGGMKTVEVSYVKVSTTPLHEILKATLPQIPVDNQYEFLNRLRVAHALATSSSTRRQILGIRILAITNLAYIHPEHDFISKCLQQDSNEPRRLQLPYQLAELLHLPVGQEEEFGELMSLQTLAMGGLEALAKHKSKTSDVCSALNVNVSHGIILYVIRKVAAELADKTSDSPTVEEWRSALFTLITTLVTTNTTSPRTVDSLVSAGLVPILVDLLQLRTPKAERSHPKVLQILETFLYSVRDAFQTLANAKGLDALADLVAFEVESSFAKAQKGEGINVEYRTQSTDYKIPYIQQQSLRSLVKFMQHMMSNGSGTIDRLLRNLIDSVHLLAALKTIIENAKIFGSAIWSGAVNIMNSFIHNEPTSYAVIAEAGLSKAVLEVVTGEKIDTEERPKENEAEPPGPSAVVEEAGDEMDEDNGEPTADESTGLITIETRPEGPLAAGIMPAPDVIEAIPQVFSAICLNTAGMALFRKSRALEAFFQIFESAEHVKCMDSPALDHDIPSGLGASFDELVRHHPPLKSSIVKATIEMVARVRNIALDQAKTKGAGTKLWTTDAEGKVIVAGGRSALLEEVGIPVTREESRQGAMEDRGGDVEMSDADAAPRNENDVVYCDDLKAKENDLTPSVSQYLDVAARFLSGFFANPSLCQLFISQGGVEYLYDFCTLPSLEFNFNERYTSAAVTRVVQILSEQKPYLILPTMINRAQKAVDSLSGLLEYDGEQAFFAPLINLKEEGTDKVHAEDLHANGTRYAKRLVTVHTYCNVLNMVFSANSLYGHRPASNSILNNVNLGDMYQKLVTSLGALHRVCVWEEILLQKSIPDSWKDITRAQNGEAGSKEASDSIGLVAPHLGVVSSDAEPTGTSGANNTVGGEGNATTATEVNNSVDPEADKRTKLAKDELTPQFKNARVLRFLLSQIPTVITPFQQALTKVLVGKRASDQVLKQSAYAISGAMAESMLKHLQWKRLDKSSSVTDKYAYWLVMLTAVSQLLLDNSERPHPTTNTVPLQVFKEKGGFEALKTVLDVFLAEIAQENVETSNVADGVPTIDKATKDTSAYGGIKIILSLFSQIVVSKNLMESSQTTAISSRADRGDRDRGRPDYFLPQQFLVELRMAVLPTAQSMWESGFVDKASSSIVKSLIEILRTVLEGDGENGAYKRADKFYPRVKGPHAKRKISSSSLRDLTASGYSYDLAQEALFRCNDNTTHAREYCVAFHNNPRMEPFRNPVPSDLILRPSVSGNSATGTPSEAGPSTSANRPTPLDELPAEVEEAGEDMDEIRRLLPELSMPPPPPAPGVPNDDAPNYDAHENGNDLAMSIDNLLTDLVSPPPPPPNLGASEIIRPPGSSHSPDRSKATEVGNVPGLVCVEDLDEKRTSIRSTLVEKALDVLHVHGDVTFELADLVKDAVPKIGGEEMRKEIGETLVQSLISLQFEEGEEPQGKKIASYAHLLALILQYKSFLDASLEELKDNFDVLLTFVKIDPSQVADESSPWISNILLILERLLCESAQPRHIKWVPPVDDKPPTALVETPEFEIPFEGLESLFTSIVEILPKIGKDETLALSVARTLVILTRQRELALRLGEKRNLQRLFVMVKQLAGMNTDKINSSILIVLRHIIEDDEILRQIMRTEIKSWFESRPQRNNDTSSLLKHMHHLILRNPDIFVAVVNEKVKLAKYDSSNRHQIIVLRKEEKGGDDASKENTEESLEKTKDMKQQSQQDTSVVDDVKPSTEQESSDAVAKPKAHIDAKLPIIEKPDGVIHYLLCELLSYKDVEDKEATVPTIDIAAKADLSAVSEDIEMSNTETSSSSSPPAALSTESKKLEKQEFKADQHPIYIYRCFILQCLTEILSCYNRTKIEFISFSRKAQPRDPITPTKPRSAVLNYLLTEMIPVGTLDNHVDDLAFRKRSSTSGWAMTAVTSLISKTGESGFDRTRDISDVEEEAELLYVRKFVLDHALKAYKDACSSTEPLDARYARMLNLSDLFYRLQTAKPNNNNTPWFNEMLLKSQQQLSKIMFEKNYIAALTNSLADIDLNFPGAKRAIKYILRPLRQLTQTGKDLSETSSISATPEMTDEDELSSTTSVSEGEDREETPDLFRNSTLGMFEPGQHDDDSDESDDSEDEDEEMYDDDDGYDEEMYEEEMVDEDGEIISDEDEIEGLPGDVGVDVEVVISGDDDDDSSESNSEDDDEDMDDDVGDHFEVMEEVLGDDGDELYDGPDGEETWSSEDDDEGEDGGFDANEDLGDQADELLNSLPLAGRGAMANVLRRIEEGGDMPTGMEPGDLDADMEEDYLEGEMEEDEEGLQNPRLIT